MQQIRACFELQVTVVKTALGLQTAFERGDAHIEVQDHLYLPDLELSMGTLMAFHDDRSPVKSIRVCPPLECSPLCVGTLSQICDR